MKVNWRSPLLGTFVIAALLVVSVTGWLLSDPHTSQSNALRTGALAGGAVVALYALWLNDRRRRVEEGRKEIEAQRQDLEAERTDHDRERVADERFARAVELLGNEADQVRVGALHALVGLARSRPAYTQTVLAVLCSYLRRPFDHPDYARARDPESAPRARSEDADRERVVRRTAQELIAALLTPVDEDGPAYDLDLTGATLEYFDVSYRAIGTFTARHTNLYSSNSLHHARVAGNLWLTAAHSWGTWHAHHAVFGARAWFSGFTAHGPVNFEQTEFHGPAKFSGATFAGAVSVDGVTFAGTVQPDEHGVIGRTSPTPDT